LFPPPVLPPLTAAAKGLKEDDVGAEASSGAWPKPPPRPPKKLEPDEGEGPPGTKLKKLEVGPVGLGLLPPAPKPPPKPANTAEGFEAEGCDPN
jgi:hypothetical protein